jgi:nucleotide-binding universal stress UspA family protein
MIKRILVGLAGTTFTSVAIQRAVALAKVHDAEVTGVTMLCQGRLRSRERQVPAEIGHLIAGCPDSIEESIKRLEQSCKEAGVKCRLLHESGEAFTTLIDAARYHDVIVFGLGSVLKYAFPGDDPHDQLIRIIGAGVRPLIAVSEEFRSISRVLIAYNGSMESAKAMKRFVQMRLWPEAELKVMTFNSSDDRAYELLLAAEEYCRAHGFKVCHESNPGDPRVLLLPAATLWQADMIVMGNSARSVLLRKVLGDTLLTTLAKARIPLFLAQ